MILETENEATDFTDDTETEELGSDAVFTFSVSMPRLQLSLLFLNATVLNNNTTKVPDEDASRALGRGRS